MPLFYVVDGYNLILRSGLFSDKDLKTAREGLFRFLEVWRPHGSQRNRLIVVFDGSDKVCGFPQNHPFEVVFSSGENADEKIKKIVSSSTRPADIIVVTDDRGLSFSVRSYGAKTMPTRDFLKKKKTAADPGEEELNIVQKDTITNELKNIWLKKSS